MAGLPFPKKIAAGGKKVPAGNPFAKGSKVPAKMPKGMPKKAC